MKKFLFVLIAFICETFSVKAGEYKLNIKEEKETLEPVILKRKVVAKNNFELMEPVKLVNPLHKNLGLEAGGPKYTKLNNKNIEEVKPLIPSVEKKEDVKVVEVVDIVEKPTETQVNIIEKKEENVSDVKSFEDKKEVVEVSQTDKNIDEAKKLLAVAEQLANSVIEDTFEDVPAKTTNNEVVKKDVEADKKPKFVLNFAKNSENVKKSDEKKLLGVVPMVIANPDITMKIISYYSTSGSRNLAFSRLLNARKILLEKDVPTSQIMIMVLEDEEKNNTKEDTIEVFLISAV